MHSIPSLRARAYRLLTAAFLALPISILAAPGCGGSVDEGSGGSGSSSSSGGSGDGTCSADKPCTQGAACVYQAGTCQAGATGTCVTVIQCDGPPTGPVCGCDGKTVEGEYGNCSVGGPYDNPAGCQTGTFACGPSLQCTRNLDVCVTTLPGVPGGSPSYECKAFDMVKIEGFCVNGLPDCACVDTGGLGSGATCAADADHQETITIALP